MLILPIKKKWYDMIISGEKREEYREVNNYWRTRIMGELGFYDKINFENWKPVKIENVYIRNGYGNDKPTAKISAVVIRGYGNPEWGAEPGKKYYVFEILDVQELTNLMRSKPLAREIRRIQWETNTTDK